MISYSQNFEDVMLRRVFRDKTDGFYIDVGAADPTIESVTKYFYDEGWSGINIEPNPHFYRKLVEQRPRDINLNVALGALEEDRDMFLFSKIGNSTFVEEFRNLYAERGFDNRILKVKVTTLAQVCRDFVRTPVDFLKIDAEGWEKQVLEGADWEHFRPTVLVVEATEPGTQVPAWGGWESMLVRDYEMVYFDGLNRFYLLRETAGLKQHFRLPVSIHDNFKLLGTASAEEARDRLISENEELDSRLKGMEITLQAERSERSALVEKISTLQESVDVIQQEASHFQSSLTEAQNALHATKAALQAAEAENQRRAEELQIVKRDLERSQELDRELTAKLLDGRRWIGELSQQLAIRQMNAPQS